MNCIFICLFRNENYVDMFYLLLESLYIYGELSNNIEILVYTSTYFMNMIKHNKLFQSDKIKFEINDSYNSVYDACTSRLDLFDLPSSKNYTNFLYLDTDILIKGCIEQIFEISTKEILYVLEESSIDSEFDSWGRSLFGDEINNYEDKTAFSSGILLFKNCAKVRELFKQIKYDLVDRPHPFYDQPHIVYNCFKYNMFDNKILKSFAVNNDCDIQSDKVIHHFPGNPGVHHHKLFLMKNFLQKLNQFNKKSLSEKEEDPAYIIQVGSNIGNTNSDMLFENIKDDLRYIMIEPVPHVFKQLQENYKSRSNVTCLNMAISNKNATIDLFIPSEKNDYSKLVSWTSELASVNPEHIKTFVPECIVEKITVPCKTLNQLIKDFQIKIIDTLITDTEGHDYDILMNLDLSLSCKPKNIVFENKHMDGPRNYLDVNNAPKYYSLLNHFRSGGYILKNQTAFDTYLELKGNLDKFDDLWTVSNKFRNDIRDFFGSGSDLSIAEIGSYKGYTTRELSTIFSKVYAIDNDSEFTNMNKKYNSDRKNIVYILFDIYEENWEILPNDVEVVFIDTFHDYESCKKDITNALKGYKNLKYLIFDDYGVWDGVRRIIDELIEKNVLKFEKFIGLTNVPGPNWVMHNNVNEGVICSKI